MQVGLISFGVREFAALREVCVDAGHDPIVYAYSRSMRPRTVTDESAAGVVGRITGFSWRLPRSVLRIPRYGVVNVHSSLLPKYRGPAPVLWAIQNGDPHLGLTVHRMNEEFDAGPVLAQRGGIPIPDDVTPDSLWTNLSPVLSSLLALALERARDPSAGTPQDDEGASHAGLMEAEFSFVGTTRTAREVHNQVRTFRFMGPRRGPVATVDGHRRKVRRTSLIHTEGLRLDCADGPLWITDSEAMTDSA